MKVKSVIVASASGSIGGATWSHNQGGMYIRNRSIPTNPNTAFQVAVRNAMGSMAQRWKTLTPADRSAWDVYAFNTPLKDALGDNRTTSGIAMYIRSNVPRVQAGLPVIDEGPTTFGLADLTVPSAELDLSDQDLSVTFDDADGWAIATGGALLVYMSRPQSPTINFFKGPYRYVGKIDGASSPPTSPAVLTPLPFVVAADQTVFVRFCATDAEGRLSTTFRVSASVVA